jgi:hypothetical protein
LRASRTILPLINLLAVYRARAGDRDGSLEALEQLLDKGDGFLPTTDFFPSLGESGALRCCARVSSVAFRAPTVR